MKHLIALAALVALSQPLAARAAESAMPPAATTSLSAKSLTTETVTAIRGATEDKAAPIGKPSTKRDPFEGFVMPKYLTAQQENEARQLAYDAMFFITPAFHSP